MNWTVAALTAVVAIMAAREARAQDAPAVNPEAAALALNLQRAAVRKADAEAEAAELAARAARIPDLPEVGSMTAGDAAGQAEALALSAVQLQRAAAEIVRQLRPPVSRPIYVAAGVTPPPQAELLAFDLRTEALAGQLRTVATYTITISDDENKGTTALLATPGIISAAQIATAVLGAFQTDYRANGVTLSAPNDSAFVSAILWAGAPAVDVLDRGRISEDAVGFVRTRLDEINDLRRAVERSNATCRTLDAMVAAAKDDARLQLELTQAQALTDCIQVKVAVSSYDAFLQTYAAADGAALLAVMRQKDSKDRLAGQASLLLVRVEGVAAGSYTQSNVFSTLGAMPFHVATASVVSWRLLSPDGSVLAAGLTPLYSGYQQVTEVDRLLNGNDRASERRHRRRIDRPLSSDDQLPQPPAWVRELRATPGLVVPDRPGTAGRPPRSP